MFLDQTVEQHVRKHIQEYKSQGYSDASIRDALLKSNVDSLTVSQLMASTKNPSKAFYTKWWVILPVVLFSFFVFLFLVFVLFVD